jgi:hypothetical protein
VTAIKSLRVATVAANESVNQTARFTGDPAMSGRQHRHVTPRFGSMLLF